MSELSELYQEVILDHGKRPRNHRVIEGTELHAEGYNPLCGDRLTVYVRAGDGSIEDVSFIGTGCAICTASASLMTQHVKGMEDAVARDVVDSFHAMLTSPATTEPPATLGKLVALAGVRKYPMRVKCATLPWHTLKAALDRQHETVTTE
jgi:nitrogen fixation NifU-like protein